MLPEVSIKGRRESFSAFPPTCKIIKGEVYQPLSTADFVNLIKALLLPF